MKERFRHLLMLYVENKLTAGQKDEFFGMLSTGKYDDILSAHFDKTLYEDDVYAGENMNLDVSQNVLRQILNSRKDNQPETQTGHTGLMVRRWLAAASIVTLIALPVYYFSNTKGYTNTFVSEFVENSSRKITNSTKSVMPVQLPDGSRVELSPQSSVFYSTNQFAGKREVYMEGAAFFDIAKNARKPFYVYYNDLVTKVLGTSFHIHTNKVSGNIEVEVLTGKVQVYENEAVVQPEQKSMSLIVTPNQKAIYKIDRHFFETTLVENPVVIQSPDNGLPSNQEPALGAFVFENARLSEVLRSLEKTYGIEIVVSNEDIYKCVFSGDVAKQNLYDKLKIICLATNADYEINGTKILIKGNGCQLN